MLKPLLARLMQGHHTKAVKDLAAPPLYRGYPTITGGYCDPACSLCVNRCPVGALWQTDTGIALDMGRCLFCGDCVDACPSKKIAFTNDHRIAASSRDSLVITPEVERVYASALDKKARSVFGRSLKLRQVSAGGCNACEADTNVLNTLVFDLARFGIQFVASPRHADGILVTGPVSKNMEEALRITYDAIPDPKLIIAVGSCAISGGPFAGHCETCSGLPPEYKVDLYVPGCPPHPLAILDGLLRLLGRLEK